MVSMNDITKYPVPQPYQELGEQDVRIIDKDYSRFHTTETAAAIIETTMMPFVVYGSRAEIRSGIPSKVGMIDSILRGACTRYERNSYQTTEPVTGSIHSEAVSFTFPGGKYTPSQLSMLFKDYLEVLFNAVDPCTTRKYHVDFSWDNNWIRLWIYKRKVQ